MKRLITIGSILILGLSAAACNQAKSPPAAQRDVSKAEADRNAKVAEARKEGNQAIQRQQKDVAAEQRDVNGAVANKNYDVAIAKADGDYKVAVQQCEALSGSEQSACKERAEAQHKANKADAETLKNR